MTQTLSKQKDQRFTHSGISWQQFKLLEQGFTDSPGIQLFYYLLTRCVLMTSTVEAMRFFKKTISQFQ